METGKAKLNGEVDVHFSHQKTVRKNSKIVENENTTFKFGFKVFVGIVLIFSAGAIATYLTNNIHRENSSAQNTPELSPRNLTFDSPTYNIGSMTTDKSTNYYQNSAPVTVDKSINKFNSDINNPHQSIRQLQSVRQTMPKAEQQSPKSRQLPQPIQNQSLSNYFAPPKLAPVNQSEPHPQARVVDFQLNDYLLEMRRLGLLGRQIADNENVSTPCISTQNAWYRQTASFLRDFQKYLQANYNANYFLLKNSYLKQVTSDISYSDAQCKDTLDSQGSIIVTMSDTIRTQLSAHLPNSGVPE